jgi:transcriptional regulator with XRE-family HTH domain
MVLSRKEVALAGKLKSAQSITDWKNGSIPNADTALFIANYLGVSIQWLLTGEDDKGYSQDERNLVIKYRNLDDQGQYEIRVLLDAKLSVIEKREVKTVETMIVKEHEPVYLATSSIPVREEVKDSVIFHEWGIIEIPLVGSTAAGHAIDFGDLDPAPQPGLGQHP